MAWICRTNWLLGFDLYDADRRAAHGAAGQDRVLSGCQDAVFPGCSLTEAAALRAADLADAFGQLVDHPVKVLLAAGCLDLQLVHAVWETVQEGRGHLLADVGGVEGPDVLAHPGVGPDRRGDHQGDRLAGSGASPGVDKEWKKPAGFQQGRGEAGRQEDPGDGLFRSDGPHGVDPLVAAAVVPDRVEQVPVVCLAVELQLVDVRSEAVTADPAEPSDAAALLQGAVVQLLHFQQIRPQQLSGLARDDDAEGRQLDDLLGAGDRGFLHGDRRPPVVAFSVGDQQPLLAGVLVDQAPDRHDRVRADDDLLAAAGDQPDAQLVADVRPTGQRHWLTVELCHPFQLHLALHGLRPDEGVEHGDEVPGPRCCSLRLQR